ncbi:trichohyalin-like [Lutzomyia longipalpis]|uniref:trichohyalin-like n=1 Tax=Lutzomyia longipalpis TaxID=7200 RepID=UPI002483B7B2|nr:trichohyalin-like [Lutzomyia longipalpis]XP_055689854.1 trichohyalin-like [Lutzomyia longipalpis]
MNKEKLTAFFDKRNVEEELSEEEEFEDSADVEYEEGEIEEEIEEQIEEEISQPEENMYGQNVFTSDEIESQMRLLDDVLNILPNSDILPHRKRLSLIKWDEIESKDYEVEEMKKIVGSMVNIIRSHRNLKEILTAGREALKVAKEITQKKEDDKLRREMLKMMKEFEAIKETLKLKEQQEKLHAKEKEEERKRKEEVKVKQEDEMKLKEEIKMLKEEVKNVKEKLKKVENKIPTEDKHSKRDKSSSRAAAETPEREQKDRQKSKESKEERRKTSREEFSHPVSINRFADQGNQASLLQEPSPSESSTPNNTPKAQKKRKTSPKSTESSHVKKTKHYSKENIRKSESGCEWSSSCYVEEYTLPLRDRNGTIEPCSPAISIDSFNYYSNANDSPQKTPLSIKNSSRQVKEKSSLKEKSKKSEGNSERKSSSSAGTSKTSHKSSSRRESRSEERYTPKKKVKKEQHRENKKSHQEYRGELFLEPTKKLPKTAYEYFCMCVYTGSPDKRAHSWSNVTREKKSIFHEKMIKLNERHEKNEDSLRHRK